MSNLSRKLSVAAVIGALTGGLNFGGVGFKRQSLHDIHSSFGTKGQRPRYMPHQGKRECARRVRHEAAGRVPRDQMLTPHF